MAQRPLAFWFTIPVLALGTFGVAADRGVPAQDGISNFGQVSQAIYRGAQPDAAAIKNLQRLGVKTIIDLRLPNEGLRGEPAEAAANGILYTNVPLRGMGRPTDDQVRQVLRLIETLPGPVFIHCKHGCDRTGTIVACYRIQHDQWSAANAMKEAARYGISWFERGMRNYVLGFGQALATANLAKAPTQTLASQSK